MACSRSSFVHHGFSRGRKTSLFGSLWLWSDSNGYSLNQTMLFTNGFISLNFIPGSLGDSMVPMASFYPIELCDLLTPAKSEGLGFSHLFMIGPEWELAGQKTPNTVSHFLVTPVPTPRPEQESPRRYWSKICSDSHHTSFQITQREQLGYPAWTQASVNCLPGKQSALRTIFWWKLTK